ncbi:hypothetical protein H0H81_004223 [Sphagnurus paluster]|uniref:Uncharacterized protein n=1 Tax=Sphagnurus paluster TaxID=117069 RepID=A0A9P7FZ82_9AGAR|nr:hypothetical protein H0H81_004223 [Sphagnurus paluster]
MTSVSPKLSSTDPTWPHDAVADLGPSTSEKDDHEVPSNDEEDNEDREEEDTEDLHVAQPASRNWLLFLVSAFFLLCAVIIARHNFYKDRKPQVIYASRYSKEHKFRPAASPIITETLKDGRIRIRGAGPTPELIPMPTPARKIKKKNIKKKGTVGKGKGKAARASGRRM